MSGTIPDGKTSPNVRTRTNVPMRPVPSPSNATSGNPLPPNGASPGSNGNPIKEFMAKYRQQWSVYNDIAKEAENRCRQAFAERGIPAVISSRAKDPDRLEDKVRKRDKKNHYASVAAIEGDIVDLSGVRVALYFPSHAGRAVKIIESLFGNAEPKPMPEPKTDDSETVSEYDTTYRAIHVRATFGTEETKANKDSRDTAKIEIQVASLLMHCWSEVNHDLIYKTLGGVMENEDKSLIKQLNELVLSGEGVLEKLKNRLEARVEEGKRQFNTPYELATYLESYWLRKGKKAGGAAEPDSLEIRMALKKLFEVVSHLGYNTPKALGDRLDLMMSQKKFTRTPNSAAILNNLFEMEGAQEACVPNRPFLRVDLNKQFEKSIGSNPELVDVKTDMLQYAFEELAPEDFAHFSSERGFPAKEYVELSNYGLNNKSLPRLAKNETRISKPDVVEVLWRWFATEPHVQLSVALGLGRTRRGKEMVAAMKANPTVGRPSKL